MSSKALWEPKHQNSFLSHLLSEGLPRFSTQNRADKNAEGTWNCSLTSKVTNHPLAPQFEQTCQCRLVPLNRLTAGGAHPGAGGTTPLVWRCRFPSPWGSMEALRRPADPGGGRKVSHLRQRVWLSRGALSPLDAQLNPQSYVQDLLTPPTRRADLSSRAGFELGSPSKGQQAALGTV